MQVIPVSSQSCGRGKDYEQKIHIWLLPFSVKGKEIDRGRKRK